MPVDSNLNIRETAAMVEKQVLSIRFRPDGLTFIRENIADNLPVSAHKTCMIEPGYGSHVEAFQELFFRNQELCLPYNKVRIYYEPESWVMVPSELFDEKKGHLWLETVAEEPADDIGRITKTTTLSCPLPEEDRILVLSWEKDLIGFLKRTLIPAEFIPYFIPHLDVLKAQSRLRTGRMLCVLLRERRADFFLLLHGRIEFGNTVEYTRSVNMQELTDELVFYVFTIWNRLNLSTDNDMLCINYPAKEECEGALIDLHAVTDELKLTLGRYLPRIEEQPFSVLAKPEG